MFENLRKRMLGTSPQTPIVIKRVIKTHRGKKSRIATALTEADFKAFKAIGNVPEAHAQLGISKGVLYMWNKLGSWNKIVEFKNERSLEAKNKLKAVKRSTAVKARSPEVTKVVKAEVKKLPKTNEEEFPSHVYLAKLVKVQEETNKLLSALVNEIRGAK